MKLHLPEAGGQSHACARTVCRRAKSPPPPLPIAQAGARAPTHVQAYMYGALARMGQIGMLSIVPCAPSCAFSRTR